MDELQDEPLLLALLNSAPVVGGRVEDELERGAWTETAQRWGGTGSAVERRHLLAVRDLLQAIVRGQVQSQTGLGELLEGTTKVPEVSGTAVRWRLRCPPDRELGVRAILAWAAVTDGLPGRLRPCANGECHLFLVDHSRPGTARWCSMATCGNRMKARAHARRARGSAVSP